MKNLKKSKILNVFLLKFFYVYIKIFISKKFFYILHFIIINDFLFKLM